MDDPSPLTSIPTGRSYGDWKAPKEDGEYLIWPAPGDLLQDTADNGRRSRGATAVLIQNVPLPEVRGRMRRFLGHDDDTAPLIATGHQAELHHAGVWAKNVLIDAVAAKAAGQAYHFAVDTDAPKHLTLRWPPTEDAAGGAEPLTDDPAARTARWSALVNPPTPAHLRHLSDAFARAATSWDFAPLVPDVLASMRRLTLESTGLPVVLSNALHELDWGLGLRHHALLVSPLCASEAYLLFVHHFLARADAVAADYNASLAEYRRENKIRSPGRPMPDLDASADVCEVPFWLDDLSTGRRARAAVERISSGWALRLPPSDSSATRHFASGSRGGSARMIASDAGTDLLAGRLALAMNEPNGDPFPFDPHADGWDAAGRLLAWLRRHNLRLAPRALTLTAVLRLLAADQFVHGIGGGRYDQVLDRLIARHFQLEPPRFAVTTATLFFPPAVGQPRACVPCVRQEGHGLRHSVLGAEKRALVEAIAAAPRRSSRRSALYHEMHDRLAGASRLPAVQQWEQRLRETADREQQERALFDRELFYAIQPADRLADLIGRYRAALSV